MICTLNHSTESQQSYQSTLGYLGAGYTARECVMNMLKGFQYLGKHLHCAACECWRPYIGMGRNFSMDNFLTSLSLANNLKTSLAGTMNKVRRELPTSGQNKAPAVVLLNSAEG